MGLFCTRHCISCCHRLATGGREGKWSISVSLSVYPKALTATATSTSNPCIDSRWWMLPGRMKTNGLGSRPCFKPRTLIPQSRLLLSRNGESSRNLCRKGGSCIDNGMRAHLQGSRLSASPVYPDSFWGGCANLCTGVGGWGGVSYCSASSVMQTRTCCSDQWIRTQQAIRRPITTQDGGPRAFNSGVGSWSLLSRVSVGKADSLDNT